jgi:hypothetical protein
MKSLITWDALRCRIKRRFSSPPVTGIFFVRLGLVPERIPGK